MSPEHLHLSWTECDDGELLHKRSPTRMRSVVIRTAQPTEYLANNRSHPPVAPFVVGKHPRRLLNLKHSVLNRVGTPPNRDLGQTCRLNVSIPVGSSAESRHHQRLTGRLPVFENFEHSFMLSAGAAPSVPQKQKPMAEQPTQVPAIGEHRAAPNAARRTIPRRRDIASIFARRAPSPFYFLAPGADRPAANRLATRPVTRGSPARRPTTGLDSGGAGIAGTDAPPPRSVGGRSAHR